ncbi:MAG: hypothetical protein M0Z84_15910 [Gammaproteobacteria bacterium]|nr:hypothetical protein [Gammaproteobacteria bacterium]
MALQGRPQRAPWFCGSRWACYHDDVEIGDPPAEQAEGFSDLAFDEVAHNGFC